MTEPTGVKTLVLEGSPRERGQQHGETTTRTV